MTPLEPDRPRRGGAAIVFLLAILVAAGVAAVYYLRPRFESQPPQVRLGADTGVLGLAPLDIVVTDQGAGLRSLTATLAAGGIEHTLVTEQFRPPVAEKKITVALAKLPGLKEGPAVLRVVARDASLWHWFRGNETVLEKPITIDITPPTIELVADDRYINFGGVGALVYKASADTATSGVRIGERFFPGFQGPVKGHPDQYFVLFAHPYDAAPDVRAALVATDKAGNTREMRLAYELKNVRYKKSTIALSDSFLQNKVAPLLNDVAARQGPPKDVFVAVNERVRKQNEDKIAAITKKVTPSILWKDAFVQLSNSKVEANFADFRTYTYGGQPISSAYHLGYDLAATKNYPVEAANSGVVAFAGDLGLYGNAVIIDHGLGLFTLYGHLSSIDVKPGDAVTKRQAIGRTGETGLAGGDHLHFGVYLDGIAILPVEWWDQKWIDDNVTPKLAGRGSQEIAESQHPARGTARPARRKPR
jgi:murein DD-endopeptidase MepM/ murein hydrolase activator NlpD